MEGNAEALPFPDRAFDAYTIAFGIRNVTHIDRALAEAYRVLKIGGTSCAWSSPNARCRCSTGFTTSTPSIPRLGSMVAGDREAYRYLVESIRKFPRQERFAEMIRAAGFARVAYRNLTGGIAAIHSGWRI